MCVGEKQIKTIEWYKTNKKATGGIDMNERERILELVKQGVLSTEEGLDLLESLAKKEVKQEAKQDFSAETVQNTSFETEVEEMDSFEEDIEQDLESLDEEIDRISEEVEQTEDEEIQSEVEAELEKLANEVNHYSVELDQVNEKLAEAKTATRLAQEELDELEENTQEERREQRAELEEDIRRLQEELELVRKVDEVDNQEAIEEITEEIQARQEELEELKESDDEDIQSAIEALEEKIEEYEEETTRYQEEKAEIMRKLHSSKMKQWTTRAKQVSKKLEIPEEWKSEASDAIEKAGEQIETTGKDIGGFIRETVQSAMGMLDNVEWTDMNIRVPKLTSTEFEHEWVFENSSATILDFKNANGNIKFKSSDSEDIKVSAKVKLYGKMEEESSMEAFEARSIIEEDEDKLTFHVPNKRISANIIVSLPERTYDYLAVKLLNGNAVFSPLKVKDIYVKSTNGNITFDDLEATMLETKGTNGNVVIKESKLRDLLVNTVSGDIRFKGDVQSSDVSTTNGTIRFTLEGKEATRIKATSMNGDVKIALPKDVGIDGRAKTSFGQVKSRLEDTGASEQKEQSKHALTFRREKEGQPLHLVAKTTTGNILLKDN